jgi:small subunit ribosomal protein S2e
MSFTFVLLGLFIDKKEIWILVCLGRLVKEGKIAKLEEIYLHSLPIKEHQIIDYFFDGGKKLKDEVMKIMPVQKQTAAGQRTRFKAYVVIGDMVCIHKHTHTLSLASW